MPATRQPGASRCCRYHALGGEDLRRASCSLVDRARRAVARRTRLRRRPRDLAHARLHRSVQHDALGADGAGLPGGGGSPRRRHHRKAPPDRRRDARRGRLRRSSAARWPRTRDALSLSGPRRRQARGRGRRVRDPAALGVPVRPAGVRGRTRLVRVSERPVLAPWPTLGRRVRNLRRDRGEGAEPHALARRQRLLPRARVDVAQGMSGRYRAYRALPALKRLLRAAAHVAVWDDHDFGPNYADGSFTMKAAALAAFKRYWANPSYGLPGVPGIFGTVTWGDVEFFLLDNRFHRYPNRYPPTPDKAMFGREQLEWLKQALVASRAAFKVIVSGGQLWNPRNQYESFFSYPAEQRALAEWLVERRIEGVLFLSGDRHFSELLRHERPGTYPLFELTSSPLTAGPFRDAPADERENPELVPGTFVTERSFAMLRFAGPRRERTVTLEAYASDGRLLWQQRIAAAELR